MHLDELITMPTFRPDGRLDSLNKGKAEKWQDFGDMLIASGQLKKKGAAQRPATQEAAARPAPRAQASAPIQDATVGNRVRAKRGSLLGSSFGTGTGY